jgi:hypothetical protein
MMNRVRIKFWVCIALGVAVVYLLGASARSQPAARTNARRKALPLFPYENGWLGADAAYSIPLGSGQSLWPFGDTFVGRPRQDRAHNEPACRGTRSVSLNVTISTARCGTSGTGMYQPHPRAFFDLAGADWFWPLDGFIAQGSLHVVLEEMHAVGTGAFGFGNSAVILATIPNFTSWRLRLTVHGAPIKPYCSTRK